MARQREFNTALVLDKAVSFFWDKGYKGVSTQSLIADFGISKSSMYGAFGDKMQLFILTLERYSANALNNLKTQLDADKAIKQQIKLTLNKVVENALADKKHKGCFIVNSAIELAPHNAKIAAIVQQHRNNLETIFKNAVIKGIEAGEISDKKKPEAISRVICNALHGIQVDAKYLNSKKHFNALVDSLMQVFE